MKVIRLFTLSIILFSGISCEKEFLPEETEQLRIRADDTGDEYDEIDDEVEPEDSTN